MGHMVKWKYRLCQPGVKGRTIDHYIEYVSEQVDNRRNATGAFENEKAMLGVAEYDKGILFERESKNDGVFEQDKYLSYVHERKGSHSLFSYDGAPIEDLTKQLKKHEGAAWIPIVSLKEHEAIEFGLDTEAAWMEKARELAEEYRKILGITKENYRYVAAFHVKPPADQNLEADAGCQPHIHFIIWEDEPIRDLHRLREHEMLKVHEKTANILSREYMQTKYAERNTLRQDIKSASIDKLEEHMEDIKQLASDIHIMTDGKGKLSVREIEKRADISTDIYTNLEVGQALTQAQEYYLNKLKIETVEDARRAMFNYIAITDNLDNISDEIMNSDDVLVLVEAWEEKSMEMRKLHGENHAQMQMEIDFEKLKNEIKNAILNEVKDSQYNNYRISDSLKGMMYEKLEEGFIKPTTSHDDIMTSLTVVSELCKVAQIEYEEAIRLQQELLDRSNREEYYYLMEEIVSMAYASANMGFGITTNDFWQAMKSMSVPINKDDARIRFLNRNNYELANKTLLDPVQKSLMDAGYSPSLLDAPLDRLAYVPTTKEEYAQKYQSLLDDITEIGDAFSRGYERER